jgi:hypothetical protein
LIAGIVVPKIVGEASVLEVTGRGVQRDGADPFDVPVVIRTVEGGKKTN